MAGAKNPQRSRPTTSDNAGGALEFHEASIGRTAGRRLRRLQRTVDRNWRLIAQSWSA